MDKQFDFDSLSGLYKTDPEQFRTLTRKMIDDYIASIPDEISRRKCAGFQFKLDHELSKYHDPIARMNKMVELFWKGVYEFNNALKGTIEIKDGSSSDSVVFMNDFRTAAKRSSQDK